MPKSKKIISINLSLDPILYEKVKKAAAARGTSASMFMRSWLDNFPYHTEDVIPVVLDVPTYLTKDKSAMASFMTKKSQVIVDALCT